ncbi:MAG TPA: transcriptional regulator [Thermoanaerobacterales bacterium]|nr:transcriptional regulator [Thermoanaerobacterales bacterium]
MELVRIGDKVVSVPKIERAVREIIELRSKGISQQEVAEKFNTDRTFVSRLESIGEIRKGKRIAVVGFPIKNIGEIEELMHEEGIDFYILMTDKERWDFIKNKSGLELFNEIMELTARVRTYETVIIIGSDYRIKIIEALLDSQVIAINIGESPINEDKYVDPESMKEIIRNVKGE